MGCFLLQRSQRTCFEEGEASGDALRSCSTQAVWPLPQPTGSIWAAFRAPGRGEGRMNRRTLAFIWPHRQGRCTEVAKNRERHMLAECSRSPLVLRRHSRRTGVRGVPDALRQCGAYVACCECPQSMTPLARAALQRDKINLQRAGGMVSFCLLCLAFPRGPRNLMLFSAFPRQARM